MSQMPTMPYLRSALGLWRPRLGRWVRRAPIAFVIHGEFAKHVEHFAPCGSSFWRAYSAWPRVTCRSTSCATSDVASYSHALGQVYLPLEGRFPKGYIILRWFWCRRFNDGRSLAVCQGQLIGWLAMPIAADVASSVATRMALPGVRETGSSRVHLEGESRKRLVCL